MDKFDQLCEQVTSLTNTSRLYYPRNLKLSDKFLQAFKEEYLNQKKTFSEANQGRSFDPQFERMLKALRFHAHEFGKVQEKRLPKNSPTVNQPKQKKYKNFKFKKSVIEKSRPATHAKRGEAVYADWDEKSGMWGVFGADSGHCYDTYADEGEAKSAAKNRTDWHKARAPRRIRM